MFWKRKPETPREIIEEALEKHGADDGSRPPSTLAARALAAAAEQSEERQTVFERQLQQNIVKATEQVKEVLGVTPSEGWKTPLSGEPNYLVTKVEGVELVWNHGKLSADKLKGMGTQEIKTLADFGFALQKKKD